MEITALSRSDPDNASLLPRSHPDGQRERERLIQSNSLRCRGYHNRLQQGCYVSPVAIRKVCGLGEIDRDSRTPRLDRDLDLERARLELHANGIACFVGDL